MNAIPYLFVVLLTIFLLTGVYWALVRPIIIQSIANSFSALECKLDWAVIAKNAGHSGEAANYLQNELGRNASSIHTSFSMVLPSMLSKKRALIKAEYLREQKIFAESPKWLREIQEEMDGLVIKAILTNSPMWWFPIAVIILLAHFSNKTKAFWNQVPTAVPVFRTEHSEKPLVA